MPTPLPRNTDSRWPQVCNGHSVECRGMEDFKSAGGAGREIRPCCIVEGE